MKFLEKSSKKMTTSFKDLEYFISLYRYRRTLFKVPKNIKGTSFLVTCLADKTNHPVRRPKSQQIAVW